MSQLRFKELAHAIIIDSAFKYQTVVLQVYITLLSTKQLTRSSQKAVVNQMKVAVTQTNETVTQTTRAEIKNQKKWEVIQNLAAGILSKRGEKDQLLEEETQAKGAAENLSQ